MLALGSTPDLLRLLAVPVLGWAAWRDVATRRVANEAWYPLVALGALLLAWELSGRVPPVGRADRLYLLRTGLSLGVAVPVAYLFWRIGGFGGADAKALMALAVLVPTYPTYYLPWTALPLVPTRIGVFPLTVLTNTVLLAIAYPAALLVRNAVAGEWSPAMALGRRLPTDALPSAHGRLFEGRDGFTRRGLDLDALRMYLRWRGTTLAALRAEPERHRDPDSVGRTRRPGDGAVGDGPGRAGDPAASGPTADPGDGGGATTDGSADAAGESDGGTEPAGDGSSAVDGGVAGGTSEGDDPWAAARFLREIDGDAYGTTPGTLREGLAVVAREDEVWISPGMPFLVPTFLGWWSR